MSPKQTLLDYDDIDPEHYERRYSSSSSEAYGGAHWRPSREALIRKYCTHGSILDLGCGTGAYTELIADVARGWCLGIDRSQVMLSYARRIRPELDVVRADATDCPIQSHSVDVVVCIGLLEYVNHHLLIGEIQRVLKFGGIGIIACPNKYGAFRMPVRVAFKLRKKEYEADEPSYREMLQLFDVHNLKVLESKMDDGLVWLPDFCARFDTQLFQLVEGFFQFFGRNPFSDGMLFVVRKFSG
jgi:SAM-dependent methyltransferase